VRELFRVRKNNKFGYINKVGEVIIDFCFDFASDFIDGLARVQYNGQWAYIDVKGNIIFTLECDICTNFSEGFAALKKEKKWGYIDKTGEVALSFSYYDARVFENGIALVQESDKSKGVFINKQGNIVLSGRNFLLSKYSERLINAVENGKWGYIDINNNFIIKPQFKAAYPFREEKAAVYIKRENYGFINNMGEEIIPCKFTGADLHFAEGLCSIVKDNYPYYGYIDEKGETVIPFDYQYAGDFKEGMAVVKFKRKKKYGVITKSEKCVVESKFQHISSFNGGLAEVIIGEEYEKFHYGYINYDGDFVWEPSR